MACCTVNLDLSLGFLDCTAEWAFSEVTTDANVTSRVKLVGEIDRLKMTGSASNVLLYFWCISVMLPFLLLQTNSLGPFNPTCLADQQT